MVTVTSVSFCLPTCQQASSEYFFLLAKFWQNFNLKNMISTYPNDFSLKKWPKFSRFSRK
jgi:hypothetical protein